MPGCFVCRADMRGHFQAKTAGRLGDLLAVGLICPRTHQDHDQGSAHEMIPAFRKFSARRVSTG